MSVAPANRIRPESAGLYQNVPDALADGAPVTVPVTFVQLPPWNSQVSPRTVPDLMSSPPNNTIVRSATSYAM